MHGRENDTQIHRDLLSKTGDALDQVPSRLRIHSLDELVTDLEAEHVQRQVGFDVLRGTSLRRPRFLLFGQSRLGYWESRLLGTVGEQPSKQEERNSGHARKQSKHRQNSGGSGDSTSTAEKLSFQNTRQLIARRRPGDYDAGRRRYHQGRHLRDQRVTHAENAECLSSFSERQTGGHSDQKPADQVDRSDEQARNGVALDELAGAIHRPKEVGFPLQCLAAVLGDLSGDDPGIQIGIDSHLLAGHSIERESRCDLGHTTRPLGDDNEVDHHQDEEHDEANHDVALDDKETESLDDATGSPGPFGPVKQDEPGSGHIQAESEQRRDQDDGGKRTELER